MVIKKLNKAVFLDRDGVLNQVVFHPGINIPSAPWKISEFKLMDGVKKPLDRLKEMSFLLFVFSNQPDISRGNIEKGMTEKINSIIYEQLPIKEIKVCPHDDKDNCSCRKPKPGMILDLSKKYDIDPKKSFVIGDGEKDMNAGKNVGCFCILIDTLYNKQVNEKYRVKDLTSAVKIIEKIAC